MCTITRILKCLIALLKQVLYNLGSSYLDLEPAAIALLSHCLLLPFLHVFSHSFAFGFSVDDLLLLLLLLEPLTLLGVLLALLLPLLVKLGLPVHVLENFVALFFKFLLAFGLDVLVVTLHLVFVLLNFLEVVLVHVLLVGLRLVVAALDDQLVLDIAPVVARLFLDIALGVLVDQLVLIYELGWLLLRCSELYLINLSHHTLHGLVDAQCLLWLYCCHWLLRLSLLPLYYKVLKLLLCLILGLLWRSELLLLLFYRLRQLVVVSIEDVLLVEKSVRKLFLHGAFTQEVLDFIT